MNTRATYQNVDVSGRIAAPYAPLTKTDLAIGTVIAVVMATVFTTVSSGLSLIVTFVPGLVFAWLVFVWLYVAKRQPPAASAFLPIFFLALAVQFLHFAEEFVTGFRSDFPELYGGMPYTANLFVTFNMVSYSVFTVACLLAFTRGLRFFLIPPLFFVVYGAIGNAIAHTWWSIYLRQYFPGLISAQLFWVVGPLVLHRLVGRRDVVVAIVVVSTVVLIPLLTLFATNH
jgi:hypothetical protein